MSTHTPGPWAMTRKATNHQHLSGPGPGLIADIHRDEDAAIIAAAPDLLAALQKLVRAIDRLPGNNPLDGLADEARAAIAKATGGGK